MLPNLIHVACKRLWFGYWTSYRLQSSSSAVFWCSSLVRFYTWFESSRQKSSSASCHHLHTTGQASHWTVWHILLLNTRLQIRWVTRWYTRLQTHSLNVWRFSPSKYEKIQLVQKSRPVHLSWLLVVRKLIRGFIIPSTSTPTPLSRVFELLKNGSFIFQTFWA